MTTAPTRRRRHIETGSAEQLPVRNTSSTCHLIRCCCSVLLLPMGSAFQLRYLPRGSSRSSQLFLTPMHKRNQDAQHLSVSSAGIIVGISGPSSARSSRVGMADRTSYATALAMSSQLDHNDDDDDKVKKKRKPTKLSRIKTSRSIQNVYWTLCPAARHDRDNGNRSKNKKNRR